MKTCTNCDLPFDGIPYGPHTLDEWCFTCWNARDAAEQVERTASRREDLRVEIEDAKRHVSECEAALWEAEGELDDLRAELRKLEAKAPAAPMPALTRVLELAA